MGRVSSLFSAGILASTAAAAPRLVIPKRQDNTTTAPTFADVKPSAEINWVPCYGENLQCTYLTVPLDYADESAGTTDIAFIRYLLDENAEDLLFNPGGPGEGAVGHVVSGGATYAKQWGYNFVSFDPRGVGWTGPRVACSYDTTAKLVRREDIPKLKYQETWDETLKTNQACSEANKDTKARYVGTSAVVQDMMHFVGLQAAAKGGDPKTAQINYYGVSYGTGLGQTLVAMYPDRIRRVLLDGNLYGVAHYQGWEPSGIDDLAHAIWLFSKLCFEAGPTWCTLAEGQNSIDEVKARFDAAVKKLEAAPLTHGGKTLDNNAFMSIIQQAIYFPRNEAPKGYAFTSNVTLAVEKDDIAFLAQLAEPAKQPEKRDSPKGSGDELTIITATDIAGRYPWREFEDWKAAAERLAETAPYGAFGYSTTNGLIGLAMDSFVPPESQLFPGFQHVNTSAPVLFVNTVADPVTPMSSAHQMSQLFQDSVVFIQNSPGHGYSNAVSKCTKDILAAYFKDGTVPPKGTWCEPDNEANYYFGGPDPEAASA